MADAGNTRPDEAQRLEAALDRIARARAEAPARGAAPAGEDAAFARRLDRLIAELRTVLGRDSSD